MSSDPEGVGASVSGRVDGIDVLRGLATLGVVAIHAGPTRDWSIHPMTVGRSVPVFLVLMGVSAELWRQRLRPTHLWRQYVTSAARRLLVPYLGWLLCLIALAAATDRLPAEPAMWPFVAIGYVPWAGPTWFIGAVFLLTPLIPLLLWAAERWSVRALTLVALAVTLAAQLDSLRIARMMAEVYPVRSDPMVISLFWHFVPAYFWHVCGGIWLARRGVQVSPSLVAIALLTLLWIHIWLAVPGRFPLHENAAFALADVPLCLVLIAVSGSLASRLRVARMLGAVGRRSWGIYLGHVLVFDLFDFNGWNFQFGSQPVRWLFFLVLFGAGLLLTAVGRALRDRLGARFPVLLPRPKAAFPTP